MRSNQGFTPKSPTAIGLTYPDYNGNPSTFDTILSHISPPVNAEARVDEGDTISPGLSYFILEDPEPSASPVRSSRSGSPPAVTLKPEIPKNLIDIVGHNGTTLLHYACVQGDTKMATIRTENLLNYCKRLHSADKIRKFVNKKDSQGNSALQLAQDTMNKSLIKVLLENGADITKVKNDDLVTTNGLFDDVLLKLYDEAVHIQGSNAELENHLAWEFNWNFNAVTHKTYLKEPGDSKKTYVNQTRVLALLLREEIATKSKILRHPLIRVFLHFKREKFKFLLHLSMLYHVLWSALSFVYIFCNTHILDSTNIENSTISASLPQLCDSITMFHGNSPTSFFSTWIFYVVLVLLIFSMVKELVEIFSCDDIVYYCSQLGNVGQWFVNFTVVVVWVVHFVLRMDTSYHFSQPYVYANPLLREIVLPFFFIFGMFASLLLIQIELGKTKLLGKYIEVFVSGFKKVVTFLLAFLPLLTAFLFTFHLLLPMRQEFVPSWGVGFAKILSMMTGEVNYDDTFFEEEGIAFPDVLKAVVLVFIVVVVILLQNLLISLNISDAAELKETSDVNDLASQLEEIYLMENMMTKDWVVDFVEGISCRAGWYGKWYEQAFMVNESDFRRKYRNCKCKKCNSGKWYKRIIAWINHLEVGYPICQWDPEKGELMRLLEYGKEIQSFILEWISSRTVRVHKYRDAADTFTHAPPGGQA